MIENCTSDGASNVRSFTNLSRPCRLNENVTPAQMADSNSRSEKELNSCSDSRPDTEQNSRPDSRSNSEQNVPEQDVTVDKLNCECEQGTDKTNESNKINEGASTSGISVTKTDTAGGSSNKQLRKKKVKRGSFVGRARKTKLNKRLERESGWYL